MTIDLLGGFIPVDGDTFTVLSAGDLSGSFSNVANGARLATLAGTANFMVSYDGTTDTVVLSDFAPTLDGDFDPNGVVDGFDFLKWQRGESPNGPYNASDFNDWETNFGMTAPLSAATATVPEPGGISHRLALGQGYKELPTTMIYRWSAGATIETIPIRASRITAIRRSTRPSM